MDPRHPNLAFAANTGALVFFIGLLFSAFLPIGTAKGWDTPETILLILIPICIGVSYWAKREHDIPVVHAHGTSSEQYEAMEDLPTMVSLDAAQDNVNPDTAAVIASIIGAESSQDQNAVTSAIDTLSSGDIGESAAQAVAHNDTDHTNVKVAEFDVRGFQTQGVATIPLPDVPALEMPDLPAPLDLPEMPDLDDLLQEDANSAAPPPLDLPDLPDF